MRTELHESRIGLAEGLFVGLMLGSLGMLFPAIGWAQEKDKKAPQDAEKDPQQLPRVGRIFKVPLPITGQTADELRQSVRATMDRLRTQQVRPVLVFEFAVAKGQNEYGRGSKIGNAYDLADFLSSKDLSDAETVAFVPKSIQGHAVLDVLACKQIIMAPDAELGPAGVDEEVIPKSILADYETIARRHKKVPVEVALKLVDASRELLEVETEYGTEYTTPEGLAELSKKRAIPAGGRRVLFPAGQPARLSGVEARNKGFIQRLAANRVELARALELAPESLKETMALDGQWQAARVDIKGPIKADTIDKAERMVRDAIERDDANFICLWIDSPGGSPGDSMRLAGYLADRDPSRVRTVAYIPREARADAALIALACDQIVVHPGAVVGGEGAHAFSKDEINDVSQMIRKQIATKKSRSWSLATAMFDPALEVRQYRSGAETAYFSAEELNEQPKPDQWAKGDPVTTPGKPLSLKGDEAAKYLLASHEVNDFGRFKEIYGLDEAKLEPMTPSWAETLIAALASPGVAVALLIIGGVGLYAELHHPGMGIGAFIATVCFALFFWSRFLGGTAGWLHVILFLLGLACLALEIFVIPGFGIFGLGGGVMIITSLVLASQTFVLPHNEYEAIQFRNSLLTVAGAGVGILVAVMLLNRWLPHAPVLSQMVLNPPTEEEAEAIGQSESLADFSNLLGVQGTTTTPLLPGGKARFGQETVDVVSDGDFVPRGAEVEVVEVEGTRIVVRPIK